MSDPPRQKNLLPSAIRQSYDCYGVESFYQEYGAEYRNPHEIPLQELLEQCLRHWHLDLSSVLDLACGSGEVTLVLQKWGCPANQIEGIDPFTFEAYSKRTGLKAHRLSFEEIAQGALDSSTYSLIICSFALHLMESSRLPQLLLRLALRSPYLLILSPHKKPHCPQKTGWILQEQALRERIHARLYQSVLFS